MSTFRLFPDPPPPRRLESPKDRRTFENVVGAILLFLLGAGVVFWMLWALTEEPGV